MTGDELRAAVANEGNIRERGFEVLATLAERIAMARDDESPEMSEAREIAIRMLDYREGLGTQTQVLDAILRRVGLFPYLDSERLGARDLLAVQAHRPLEMPEDDVVFHRLQADVYRRLMDGESVVLSAPTSFGKSLVIDALIASGKYRNVAIVVPTIALIDETRRRLSRFSPTYKVITHVSQPLAERNLLVLTQERVLDIEKLPDIDLFVIDEFYKLSPDREGNADRAYLLNQAFQRLHRTGAQFYFLGPNIRALKEGIPNDFLGRLQFIRTGVSTVAIDEIHIKGGDDPHQTLAELCRGFDDPTLIYVQSPRSARDVLKALIEGGVSAPNSSLDRAVEWIAETYHPGWSVCEGMAHGIGVHHGQLPRSVAHFMVRAFRERRLRFLICTSSLIEGVNTPAKNVIVFDKKIGNANFDFFDFGNIRGRSGRMSVHHVGRVYLFHDKPDEQLPDVDIPALSQPDDTPSSMLLGLERDELTDRSRRRLDTLIEESSLPENVLRSNIGLNIERQTATAVEIRRRLPYFASRLAWHGHPTGDELNAACELIWNQLNGARHEHGAHSAAQLRTRIEQVRHTANVRQLVADQLINPWRLEQNHTVDMIVEDVLDFMRFWVNHTFPRLLVALDSIAKSVLAREGMPTGDFTVFASQVENLFLPAPLIALEEYGLPHTVGEKLIDRLKPDGDLDAALARIAALPDEPAGLTPFELELLNDVKASLPKQTRSG